MKKIHIIPPIVLIGVGIGIYQYVVQKETENQTPISSIKTIKPEKDITKEQHTFKALEENLKEIKEFDKELESRLVKANKNNSDYDFKDPMDTYTRMELEYKNKDVITPINDSPYVDFDGEHLDFSKSKHIKLEHSGFSKFVKDFYTDTIDGDSPYMENYATFDTINSSLIYEYFTHRKRTGLNEKINNLTLPILTGGEQNYSFVTFNFCREKFSLGSFSYECKNNDDAYFSTIDFIYGQNKEINIYLSKKSVRYNIKINNEGEMIIFNYLTEKMKMKKHDTSNVQFD